MRSRCTPRLSRHSLPQLGHRDNPYIRFFADLERGCHAELFAVSDDAIYLGILVLLILAMWWKEFGGEVWWEKRQRGGRGFPVESKRKE